MMKVKRLKVRFRFFLKIDGIKISTFKQSLIRTIKVRPYHYHIRIAVLQLYRVSVFKATQTNNYCSIVKRNTDKPL